MRFSRTIDTPRQVPGRDPLYHLVFSNHHVHVWGVQLEVDEKSEFRLEDSLSPDERARGDRFRFRQDRRRFVVRRGVLRLILGQYLGLSPERLSFEYSPYGKPFLLGQTSPEGMRFNSTHSADVALIAVTRGRELGVDVERLATSFDPVRVGQMCFSSRELRAIRSLPATARTEAFFRGWTRKEAYLKAKGLGLSFPLQCLEVSLSPTPALLSVCDDRDEPFRWSIYNLSPQPGYMGAVAVETAGFDPTVEASIIDDSRCAKGM